MVIKRFEVYYIDLNSTVGSEINKKRPCVVVSPDEMNRALNTVIVAPLTSTLKKYPMRINCVVDGKQGQIALDHLRSIDKTRLKNKLTILDRSIQDVIIETLIAMFS